MKIPIRIPDAVYGLEQLANRATQERLWLSDGTSGEVSSYDEVIYKIFGNSGVRRSLERDELPPDLTILFSRLNRLLKKIPQDIAPLEIMDHPLMKDVKQVSMDLLSKLCEFEAAE